MRENLGYIQWGKKRGFFLTVKRKLRIQHQRVTPKRKGQNLPRKHPHSVITKRKSKAEKREGLIYTYNPKPIDEPARRAKPTKSQYGYSINGSRLLPSRRMGINLSDEDDFLNNIY
jgi:hypothetical protein